MPETEAACLLRSGALYTRRIGLRGEDGSLLFAGVKRGAFSLYFDDAPIYHFDLDGRWQRAYIEGDHYRKSLDQAVDLIAREREPDGLTLRRRNRSRVEIDALDDSIREVAIDVSDRLGTGRYEFLPPPPGADPLGVEDLHGILDRIIAWDGAKWFKRAEDHVRVYGVGPRSFQGPFLPPDAQNPIVLLPFRADGHARTTDEFAEHCSQVAKFLGQRAIQATTLLLAGPQVLRRDVPDIVNNLNTASEWFPIRQESKPLRSRDMPVDRPSLTCAEAYFEFWGEGPSLPDENGWKTLAEARLRRVTASFGQDIDRMGSAKAIADAKSAGIAVSIVLSYGLSDPGRMESQISAVNDLPLGKGDFVYLVDFSQAAPGWSDGDAGAISDPSAVEAQRVALSDALEPTRVRGAKVTKYDPAKRWS